MMNIRITIALLFFLNRFSSFHISRIHSISKKPYLLDEYQLKSESSHRQYMQNKLQIRNNKLFLFPDPTILPQFRDAAIVNTVLFTILSFIESKPLTSDGLFHAFILGLGLWTFIGFKVLKHPNFICNLLKLHLIFLKTGMVHMCNLSNNRIFSNKN